MPQSNCDSPIILSPSPRGGGKCCHRCVEDGDVLSLDHPGGLACASSSPTKHLLGPGRCWISGRPCPSPCFSHPFFLEINPEDRENVVAAVQHRNRVSEIFIGDLNGTLFPVLVSAFSKPFPALTHFHLRPSHLTESAQGFPDTFLGGSASLLESFVLRGIPFPAFPQFILSATHIVQPSLLEIPNSGYLPLDVLTTALATLPNLKSLSIRTQFDRSDPLPTSPPASTPRAVLPALSYLHPDGVGVYSEDFLARIDTPLLNELYVVYFMQEGFGYVPELHNLIGRTQMRKPFDQATMELGIRDITIVLGYLESRTAFKLKILCKIQWDLEDWDDTPMVQIFSQQLLLFSRVEDLKIKSSEILVPDEWDSARRHDSGWDTPQWLRFLHLFIAVRSMHVSKDLVPLVEPALQELVGARTMKVLPALRDLSSDGLQPSGPLTEGIQSSVAARQLAGHPVEILACART